MSETLLNKKLEYWEHQLLDLGKRNKMIRYIVTVEQPLHMDLLYKRMGSSFTTGKATEGVKNTIDAAIAQKLNG